MIRRMGSAKRNPSSWPVIARGVMGFASLYPSYARDQAAVVGSGSGGAPVEPPPNVPPIASARSVSDNGLVRSALAPHHMPPTRVVSWSLIRKGGVVGQNG